MTPKDQGRFCSSCRKTVVDFSNMSDSQLAAFFKKPVQSLSKDGYVCGRFYNDQLDRDIEIPRKRIPWAKYFFQFVLPAFLISMKATAQGKTKIAKKDTVALKEVVVLSWKPITFPKVTMEVTGPIDVLLGKVSGPVVMSNAPDLPLAVKSTPQLLKHAGYIKGKVIDENERPVPNGTIYIKGTSIATLTNAQGEFTIKPEGQWNSVILTVSSIGYQSTELKVPNNMLASSIVLPIIRLQVQVMGQIICVKPAKKEKSKKINKLTQKLMDSAFNFFKVFPNPVNSGASVHIEWKEADEGYYLLDLIDLSGKKVFSKETWIDKEARVLNLEIPSMATGNYFLKATNKNSGKSSTEQIIVQ